VRWRAPRGTGLAVALALVGLVAVPALAVVIQQGQLRVMISARLQPFKLPRTGTAPVDVFIAGHIASTDGPTPPQLRRMDILLNHHGRIDPGALPRCHLRQIATATNQQALERCGRALVGAGHFWASIVLPSQRSYHTTGRLLVFNGVQAGRPYLFAHIYTAIPFPSSFAVSFSIRHVHRGPYGTELSASLPEALGDWGYVNRIKMTVGRARNAERGSYISAGCPAPKDTRIASFSLALVEFHFAGGKQMRASLNQPCAVRE